MAFFSILRRSVSAVVARAVSGHRIRHVSPAASIFASRHSNTRLPPAFGFTGHRNFSATSDKKLLDSIEDIKFNMQSKVQAVKVPDQFPFEIEPNPEEKTITLQRHYHSDTVTIKVDIPELEFESESISSELDDELSLELVVRVSKYNESALEFSCIASPDEITIKRLCIEDPEQDPDSERAQRRSYLFALLDGRLRRAFYEYLEIRGVGPRTTSFLSEYIPKYMSMYKMEKKNEVYLEWLNNLKKVVEA